MAAADIFCINRSTSWKAIEIFCGGRFCWNQEAKYFSAVDSARIEGRNIRRRPINVLKSRRNIRRRSILLESRGEIFGIDRSMSWKAIEIFCGGRFCWNRGAKYSATVDSAGIKRRNIRHRPINVLNDRC